MPAEIKVVGMYNKIKNLPTQEAIDPAIVDTTSRSGVWSGLSPFLLGPCPLYDGRVATNVENAWQFAKLYAKHADADGNPTAEYWKWAEAGWKDPKPHRYPMGKGARPLCSIWMDKSGALVKLGYVEARKEIYAPVYARAVRNSNAFAMLSTLYTTEKHIVLRDYDGYDEAKDGMSLSDVLNLPTRKMGHSFILKAMLTNDPVLAEFNI